MNRRTVLASLNKIANQLDIEGLHNEADTVTKVMSRLAYDLDEYGSMDDMGYCPECQEISLIDGKCEQCGYGEDEDMEDYDMGPEKEPFDFNSPEDEGDMYGDDMEGYMDKDSDF